MLMNLENVPIYLYGELLFWSEHFSAGWLDCIILIIVYRNISKLNPALNALFFDVTFHMMYIDYRILTDLIWEIIFPC